MARHKIIIHGPLQFCGTDLHIKLHKSKLHIEFFLCFSSKWDILCNIFPFSNGELVNLSLVIMQLALQLGNCCLRKAIFSQ